mgnify:CR=1 FL=1|tara:strand:- start:623 stop:1417 length:795 start_codon:yes stop_codon:yes gene_type:complete
MKIYFDGCAKTGGYSRTGRGDRRYPKLLCEKLGAKEYNLAHRGGNNRRLVRNLLEHNLSEFDLFVIQMTKRKRFEYFDRDKLEWISIGYRIAQLPPEITGADRTIDVEFVEMRREGEINLTLHTIWEGDVITVDVTNFPALHTPRSSSIIKHGDDTIWVKKSDHMERYKINEVSDETRKKVEYYLYYFKNIYTEKQGRIDEQMCFSTIKSILKNHKHIIMYMHSDTETSVPVDLHYKKGKDYVSGWYMGANTHQIIMDDILKLL